MNKIKAIKIVSHIIFVVSVFGFICSFVRLDYNGNAFDILANKKYESTDYFYYSVINRLTTLSSAMRFSDTYYVNKSINRNVKVTDKYTVGELLDKVNYEDLYNAYLKNQKVYTVNGFKFSSEEIDKVVTFFDGYKSYLQTAADMGIEKTNFRYYVSWTDNLGIEHLFSNVDSDVARECKYTISWTKEPSVNAAPEISLKNIDTTNRTYGTYDISAMMFSEEYKIASCNIFIGVDDSYVANDEFSIAYHQYYDWKNIFGKIFYFSFAFMLISLCTMIIFCGRRKGMEGVYLNEFDKLPSEIGFLIIVGAIAVSAIAVSYIIGDIDENVYSMTISTSDAVHIAGVAFVSYIGLEACIGGLLSFVRRIKANELLANTIVARIGKNYKSGLSSAKPNVVKKYVVLIFLGYILVNSIWFYLVLSGSSMYGKRLIIFIIGELIIQVSTLSTVVFFAAGYVRVQQGVRNIAAGETEFKIDTENIDVMNRRLAKDINRIGDGMSKAVDDSIKNERLKTDLITNVSHDIKTPLTSIINYVGLLKRENIEDERIQGYINVLDEKSMRLKVLTEDLVEASKLSSGVMKLNLTRLNLKELVNQVNGEFKEKLDTRNLTVVCNMTEEELFINGDGQRIWRILENIYNNAFKYSLEGTRIYVDVLAENDKAVISVKNVSENPMNFNVDELTERFIRGDVARSTEGSGLGLSIVKSLVNHHKGKIKLSLDGDLFKVRIEFNRIN